MSAPTGVSALLRRASEWLIEPLDAEPDFEQEVLFDPRAGDDLSVPPPLGLSPRRHPLVAVVGLARRCGATTIARALASELAARHGGAAVVAAAEPPAVVALGASAVATRLAERLPELDSVRVAGRLCLGVCGSPGELARATRSTAPAVIEVEPGVAAVEAAPSVDRVVLVVPPALDPRLAAAVAETVSAVADPPVLVVNRCREHGPWPATADVLVPDSRLGARFALAGRDPRGWLGGSIRQLADLCAVA